jgi:hypothetical protein
MTRKISDQASDRPAADRASLSGVDGPGRVALARMRRLIGGAFGLVYVVAGAGALPSPTAPVLRLLAIAAFVGLLITARMIITGPGDRAPETAPFSRGYWIVVAAEAVAIGTGVVVLAVMLHAPRAILGWVTLVVGVHFFGLAHVWKRRFYTWLGAVITACGVAGLAAAAVGAPATVIAAIAAITPGLLLLAASFLLIGRYRGAAAGAARGRPGQAAPGTRQDPKTAQDFQQAACRSYPGRWPATGGAGIGWLFKQPVSLRAAEGVVNPRDERQCPAKQVSVDVEPTEREYGGGESA